MYGERGVKCEKDHNPATHIEKVLGNPALAGCGVEQPRLDGIGDPKVPEEQLALEPEEEGVNHA